MEYNTSSEPNARAGHLLALNSKAEALKKMNGADGLIKIATADFWSHKPLDLAVPFFLIRTREGHRMAALLAVASIGKIRKDGRDASQFQWRGNSTGMWLTPAPGQPADVRRNDVLFGFKFVGWKRGDVDVMHAPITFSGAECE
ncbi:hypothetical protein HBH56_203990 [Parastagonospora nodorum]|uniref:Uncharacterized protein n=1 Tax=Phaeosphaeria nodorum (strain SN15 / ATCC MYA-4574 / FGSC 10173) TaxID=321614 RepID=A0A7U2FAH4_PHANO|nr:hypothetical protein HBH56_203990 [Parastagonospora nodorum]QRD01709.1 hypothetical protein JI435_439610 [Parastagonospora nodorum SN15]KAH3923976.1 hypothetical protein HBH54_202860 [Parastagonospora nodorum]KAH4013758.1 hypothetical protein HBI09_213550 [Parastagonospora nodorum]KAH4042785.1 hypothetical protein HBH49_242750 [Parastagonospora nodorum]